MPWRKDLITASGCWFGVSCFSALSYPNCRCQEGAEKSKPKQFWRRLLIVHMGEFDFSVRMEQSEAFLIWFESHFNLISQPCLVCVSRGGFYSWWPCKKTTGSLWHSGICRICHRSTTDRPYSNESIPVNTFQITVSSLSIISIISWVEVNK